jgi:hypothetical protein
MAEKRGVKEDTAAAAAGEHQKNWKNLGTVDPNMLARIFEKVSRLKIL